MISNQGSSWNQNPLHSARPDEVDAESIHNTIGRGYGSTHGGERGMGSAVTINRYGTYNSHNSNLNKFGSISSATSSVLFHGASTASNVNIHHGHKIPSTNIDEASSVDNNIVFASSTATRYAPTTATNTTNTTFMKSRREFKNTTHGGLLTIALFIDRTTHVAGGEVT